MRSPTLASALLLVLSAAAPSPAREKADAIVEPSTKAPHGKLLEWKGAILGDFRRRDIVISPDGMTPGQGGTFNVMQGAKDGEQIAGLITDSRTRATCSTFATAEENSPQGDE